MHVFNGPHREDGSRSDGPHREDGSRSDGPHREDGSRSDDSTPVAYFEPDKET